MEMIDVNREDLIVKELWWQERGLQQTASGFGSKLTTRYMFKHGNRLKRVYCVCFSNSGSFYIIEKGKKVYLNVFG